MSKSGQLYIAQTEGTAFTLYKVMEMMGIPLSDEQRKCQAYLEQHYPEVVDQCQNDKPIYPAGCDSYGSLE